MTHHLKPLAEEHEELRVSIDALRETADRIGEISIEDLRGRVRENLEFLTHHLIPHAMAEDEVLYPVIDRLMGSSRATATMSRDHIAVANLTAELETLTARLAAATPGDLQAKELRRILYGLHALVWTHLAKEEEVYVPILDAGLSETEAREVFVRMEQVAEKAREQAFEREHPGSRSLPSHAG